MFKKISLPEASRGFRRLPEASGGGGRAMGVSSALRSQADTFHWDWAGWIGEMAHAHMANAPWTMGEAR